MVLAPNTSSCCTLCTALQAALNSLIADAQLCFVRVEHINYMVPAAYRLAVVVMYIIIIIKPIVHGLSSQHGQQVISGQTRTEPRGIPSLRD